MKKAKGILLSVILIFLSGSLHAESFFSNYDFTFYKTVYESLQSLSGDAFGFDYTGFGFLGKSNHGLMVRIGFQFPLSSLANIIKDKIIDRDKNFGKSSPETLSTAEEVFNYSEKLTFLIGPAMKHSFSPEVLLYSGVGLKINENIEGKVNRVTDYETATYETNIALDYDIGIRVLLEKHFSCRIGIYGSYSLMRYTVGREISKDSNGDDEKESYIEDMHLNLIAYGPYREKLNSMGYVSVAKSFVSGRKADVYSYIITEREMGKGELVKKSTS